MAVLHLSTTDFFFPVSQSVSQSVTDKLFWLFTMLQNRPARRADRMFMDQLDHSSPHAIDATYVTVLIILRVGRAA